MTFDNQHHEIAWPDWVDDVFDERGLVLLRQTYTAVKGSNLERAGRISAEDIATALAGAFVALGRTNFLKRMP